jgi:methyltransferase
MVTHIIFIAIVLALAAQRLLELRWSRRNQARILATGGREHAPGHFGVMKVVHVAWFVAMIVEVFGLARPFVPALAACALLIFLIGQSLRYAAIRTLGWRWTVRIMTLPDAPLIRSGIYRYMRHPNYLGLVLEIAAVPLLHTAYLTAILFTLANACVLAVRIRAEERALRVDSPAPHA